MKPTTVFAIGRWMPIHLGHKAFLTRLARTYDRLVIGIGSCYENGTPRNCIPAVEREKLLYRMLRAEGIENAVILPVEDRPTFEEWIADVCEICRLYDVTHFCTGNKEDILDVLAAKGMRLDVEMINPEDGSDFPYHATDIRNAILMGEWERLDAMIPAEIKPMVLDGVAKEIRAANEGRGQAFIPGRQTVDLILLVRDPSDGKTYLLIGKRDENKIDFPSAWAIPGCGIAPFESPIDAALRAFLSETGLTLKVTDRAKEPCDGRLFPVDVDAPLHFIGIYASEDKRINGSRGGGSQCFAVLAEARVADLLPHLHASRDMTELRFLDLDALYAQALAFDQKHMVYDALSRFGITVENGEELAVFGEDGRPTGEGVSRTRAHEEGVLHGASHTYIYRRDEGGISFLLQRRSGSKDSYPLCLDISSAGHVERTSDHLETACRELAEELGLTVAPEALTHAFTHRVFYESAPRGKRFLDAEVAAVYLLKADVDVSTLSLQPSEVCEAVWLPADEILCRLEANDAELSLVKEEFVRVLNAVREREK